MQAILINDRPSLKHSFLRLICHLVLKFSSYFDFYICEGNNLYPPLTFWFFIVSKISFNISYLMCPELICLKIQYNVQYNVISNFVIFCTSHYAYCSAGVFYQPWWYLPPSIPSTQELSYFHEYVKLPHVNAQILLCLINEFCIFYSFQLDVILFSET